MLEYVIIITCGTICFLIFKIRKLHTLNKLQQSTILRQIKETNQLNTLHKESLLELSQNLAEFKPVLIPIKAYTEMLLTEHWGELSVKQKQRLKVIQSYAASLLLLIQKIETKLVIQ